MNHAPGSNVPFQWNWNSSVSFLYGGLAPIFIVIGIALLIVACSRSSGSETETSLSNSNAHNNRRREERSTEVDDHDEPNILVIVAGEEHPTHLAKPLSFTHP